MHGGPIDWVIAGGESGPKARPMHPDWVRGLRDQCQAAGVPFFFKQWGEWVDEFHPACHDANGFVGSFKQSEAFVELVRDDAGKAIDFRGLYMMRVGKDRAGRTLDGRERSEFPAAFGREVARA